jgi:hypothetical protein
VDLYLHNPTCSGSSCYSDTITLTADADGIVTVPGQSVGQPAYEMLRISAAKYVDRDVVGRIFSAPSPVTIDVLREAPHLEDLRQRLVDSRGDRGSRILKSRSAHAWCGEDPHRVVHR